VARLLKVTYGTLVLGTSQTDASLYLSGVYGLVLSPDRATFTFEVEVSSSTRATFLTAEAALIAALVPRKKLEVVLDGTTRHTWDPAATVNTGYDAEPVLTRTSATGNSSGWRVAITLALPPSYETAVTGLREASWSYTTTASGVGRLALAGEFAATGSNSAYAQYVASIDTFEAEVTAITGGTWNRTQPDSVQVNRTNKSCAFQRVLEEILANEGVGTLNVAGLVVRRFVVAREDTPAEGDPEQDVGNVIPVTVELDADVVRSVTTDLASMWTGTVRPRMIEAAAALAGGSSVLSSVHKLDLHSNRISATVTLLVQAGRFLRYSQVLDDARDEGSILYPVADGSAFGADVYETQPTHLRALTLSYTRRTSGGRNGTQAFQDDRFMAGRVHVQTPPGWLLLRASGRLTYQTLGIAGERLPVEIATVRYEYRRVERRNAAVDSAGGLGFGFGLGGFGLGGASAGISVDEGS
jgi:hypothetical protein